MTLRDLTMLWDGASTNDSAPLGTTGAGIAPLRAIGEEQRRTS